MHLLPFLRDRSHQPLDLFRVIRPCSLHWPEERCYRQLANACVAVGKRDSAFSVNTVHWAMKNACDAWLAFVGARDAWLAFSMCLQGHTGDNAPSRQQRGQPLCLSHHASVLLLFSQQKASNQCFINQV